MERESINNMSQQTFILTDSMNLFHRQIHMTDPRQGIDSMIGMALHLILNSMKKEYRNFSGTHCVFMLEGRSWRKSIYPQYKGNRVIIESLKTPQEQEDNKILMEAYDDFSQYICDKTNITTLRAPNAEADDMFSVFIESHPDDNHILISSDSDFFILLKYPNVTLYDPIKDIIIKQDGIYDDFGKRLSFQIGSNAKIKVGKPDPNFVAEDAWYEYAMFLKCIRGDGTDNIFSAYPGAREKGTKNSVGIKEAFADRNNKGYAWNNFFNQKWIDHNQVEQTVKEKYEFNKSLIDLTAIPEYIKNECLNVIAEETNRKDLPAVEIGMSFMRFCGKWNLKKIGDNSADFMPMMKSKYKAE